MPINYWKRDQKADKKKKLEIFLQDVNVLDDFLEDLTPIEYQLIYLKCTKGINTWQDVIDNLNGRWLTHKALKEDIEEQFGEITLRKLQQLYARALDRLLDKVTFEYEHYSWHIFYSGRGKNLRPKYLPARNMPKENLSWITQPEVPILIKSDEQIAKIKANRVLEQQEQGGLYDKPMSDMLKSQNKAIEDNDED